MSDKRSSFHVTIALLLLDGDNVLLMHRIDTGYMDGMYGFVSGHLEENESLKSAMAREVYEELGIKVNEDDMSFVCAIRRGENSDYFNCFFVAKEFDGEPRIRETEKCDEIRWCNINLLPENTITAEKRAIHNYLNGIVLDEYDFINT